MDYKAVKNFLIKLGLRVNARCVKQLSENFGNLNQEVKMSPADIIYGIDIEAEEEIIALLKEEAESFGGIELIAEGIGNNDISYFPDKDGKCQLKIICDPIDGSRGLMYGKRSAFFLAAAGDIKGKMLSDMEVSVMVELPIPKQTEFDVLSALKGGGFEVFRYNIAGDCRKINLSPVQENSVEGGFVNFTKFCYPGKDIIARIEELFLDKLFAKREKEFLPVFDDQYISTGGQLYELICGKDRLTVDCRASLYKKLVREGKKSGQICHPYDMAGYLVAVEAGVLVESLLGQPFDAPLNSTFNVDWVGFANINIKNECGEFLKKILQDEGLI